MRVLLGFSLIVTLTGAATALAQTGPPCPRGSGLLTPAKLGGDIRDGQGVGAANLGSTPADIERLWGAPESCLPRQQGHSYNYFLTGDGGQTGWLVVVVFMDGKATDMVVSAVPHARGPGPTTQTRAESPSLPPRTRCAANTARRERRSSAARCTPPMASRSFCPGVRWAGSSSSAREPCRRDSVHGPVRRAKNDQLDKRRRVETCYVAAVSGGLGS